MKSKTAGPHEVSGSSRLPWPWVVARHVSIEVLVALVALCSPANAVAGPAAVPKVNPSSAPAHLVACGESLFFTADDGVHGRELWKSDAQGRCALVADLNQGPPGSDPSGLKAVDGWLYFLASTQQGGQELWMVAPQTCEVRPALAETISSGGVIPRSFDAGGGRMYIFGQTNDAQTSLHMTTPGDPDAIIMGTFATEERFATMSVVFSDGRILFDRMNDIWVADPETQKAYSLPDVGLGQFASMLSLAPPGNRAVLASQQEGYGAEPWITDGTSQGTYLLKDISPGEAPSNMEQLTTHEDSLYFSADDGVHGTELWKSDGTEVGTVLLSDIAPGPSSAMPHYLQASGPAVYFVADDGIRGEEIWMTDGTQKGTRPVCDLAPGIGGSGPWSLTDFQGKLCFCANSSEFGEELYITDGVNTQVIKDISAGIGGSGPGELTALGEHLFFVCDDGIHGEELWISDGTPEGTRIADDIAPPRLNPSSFPHNLTAFRDRLLFVVRDMDHGEELWLSDGTDAGTLLLADIKAGPAGSSPDMLTNVGSHVLFAAEAQDTGRELWVTDGTREGTRLLRDLREGPGSSSPQQAVVIGHMVYLTAEDEASGRQVWRSDGTPEGTISLKALAPYVQNPNALVPFELFGKMYVYIEREDRKLSLWRIDSDELVAVDIAPQKLTETIDALGDNARGTLREPGIRGEEDLLTPIVRPYSISPQCGDTAVMDGITYFALRTDDFGTELWKTDGTLENTSLVCDAYPGPVSSSPTTLTVADGFLYFAADHPREGRILWRSEGDPKTTREVRPHSTGFQWPPLCPLELVSFLGNLAVASIQPSRANQGGPGIGILLSPDNTEEYLPVFCTQVGRDIYPRHLTPVDSRLFFSFDDGTYGEELWVTDGTLPNTRVVKDILGPEDLSSLDRH